MRVNLETTVGDLVRMSGGKLLCGDPSFTVGSISTDSRDLDSQSFFIPLKGEKFDGHDFIPGLLEAGRLSAFLTARSGFEARAREAGAATVLCDDTLVSYGHMAHAHRASMGAKVIGITGTSGKTTVKELLWVMLSSEYSCHKNEKNYNNEIGVPHALLGIQKDHRFAVIEMGMNHSGEIERLSKMAGPDLAVITSVGEGHLEFLGTVENVALAKGEIMSGMKKGSRLFINADSRRLDIILDAAKERGMEVALYSLHRGAMISPDSYSTDLGGVSLSYRGEEYRAPLYGIHNASNLLAALAVALELGIAPASIRRALENLGHLSMRSEVIDRGYVIINDTYNSNPLSAESALESVAAAAGNRKKIAVLSDMKELGEKTAWYHRELGKKVAAAGFDVLYTWGELAEEIAGGAREAGMAGRAEHFADKEALITALKNRLTENDIILVKGSRSMKMEEVVNALVH